MKTNITNLVDEILSSRKNVNKILELVSFIDVDKSKDVMISAIEGAVKVFTKLFENGDILFGDSAQLDTKSSIEQYKFWIGDNFTECYQKILDCLIKVSTSKQELVLKKIMELLRIKSRVLCSQEENEIIVKFCKKDYLLLLNELLLHNKMSLLEAFCTYLEYDDVRYIILKTIPAFISNILKLNQNDENVLDFLFNLLREVAANMPDDGASLHKSFLCSDENSMKLAQSEKKSYMFNINEQRKVFGIAWIGFLKQPLSGSLRKDILINLHSALISNFAKPSLLVDFLTKSFNEGGGLALLSLQGLFVLVNDFNLEYPDFYKNLYSLLHPRIFEKRYKVRFFNLLKVFLSSTHIPSYVVAAFVKKMARLALCAPPHGILAILNLISRMIHTHPGIAYLINGDASVDISEDPFLEFEEDLASCQAAKSSLWEVDALLDHYLSEVCKAASIVKKSKIYRCDSEKILESGYEGQIKFDDVAFTSNATSHIAPSAFIGGYEDTTAELWSM